MTTHPEVGATLPLPGRRYLLLAAGLFGTSTLAAVALSPHALAQQRPSSGPTLHVDTGRKTTGADPVTFLADRTEYDDKRGLVTWSGNVQIWQGDQVLRADTVTYNRDTGVAAARGHVAIVEPDGSVLFSNYAELSNGMKDGIMTRYFASMNDNAKLAASGARRTNGQLNDMSHAVYTACNICAQHPERPPFWQLRAYGATQDVEHQTIEFRHAWIDFLGVPLVYLPWFSMTDPSVKRRSGFLTPGISPHDRYLGTYFTLPYYWVINDQSDVTFQGLFSTRTAPQLSAQYRNLLNFGKISIMAGAAYDTHNQSSYTNLFGTTTGTADEHGLQGYVFAKGDFAVSRYWSAGANINLATSANYMRDYRVQGYGQETLNSNVYLEGLGTGGYARLDGQFYQGLNQGVINDSELPWVLPRFLYRFNGQPDAWGGRFSFQTQDFDVYRSTGASDQRGQLQMNWDRPFHNKLGQQWLLTLRLDSMVYRGTNLDESPIYVPEGRSHVSGQVLPTVALKMNWPFLRTFARGHGAQILEPIAQVIAAPNTGNSNTRYLPNEDSLSYEFTDSTLFSLNRYNGTDRLDGGIRANFGVHSSWNWNGHEVDMLVGESVQEHIQQNRLPYSGLNHHLSDIVGRLRLAPNPFLNMTVRGRIDPYTGRIDFGDGLLSAGVNHFHVFGGYVYEPVTPYYYYVNDLRTGTPPSVYFQRTNEVTAGFSTNWREYHLSAYARRSLSRHEFVALGGDIGYSNDCFGIDLLYLKQYTSIGGQQRNSTILFNLTFKTIGSFGVK
ncbi:organic solvent tolerance protein [Ameyamaea chiangmaiensis NBRC 103196]|uniref:LPS-assembly protein LptD n=1 Tax=Ameyamaea chiangmaiensis TaxID=442969 RepID=A0A850PEA6_9PROT|nr:LPS assembly protein LptD [Ameyamaea chiangmaiensis]MBS4074636.1 LPS-assembly protein LptD [Ameyamaea chiangmaiensis]NVN39391.1 LPS-assembly protein LptD [Ameyamaea chiangmaiensis]GBQ64941.1 organic solvent tolerance protein [Ameyamaea chiangmaiensis NBRC 103196]